MSNYTFSGKRLKVLNDTPIENDSGKYIGTCSIEYWPRQISDYRFAKRSLIFTICEKIVYVTDAVFTDLNILVRKSKVPLCERDFKIFNKFKIPRIGIPSISYIGYKRIPLIEEYAYQLITHRITEDDVPIVLKDAVMHRTLSYNNI